MRLSLTPGGSIDFGSAVVPGSKSHTIRALFAALAADGSSTLLGPLDSADTRAARAVIEKLGGRCEESPGVWAIAGTGGDFVEPEGPLSVGESGLTARHLVAFAALVPGRTVITAGGRLPVRPMRGVLDAVRGQGATSKPGYPWVIDGAGNIPGGAIQVDGSKSSQMVSAILMTAPLADFPTLLEPLGVASSGGYLTITVDVMRAFGGEVSVKEDGTFEIDNGGYRATTYSVPPDASAAVYPFVGAALTGHEVTVPGEIAGQPDSRVLDVLEQMGCRVTRTTAGTHVEGPEQLVGVDADLSHCPDGALGLAVAAVVASSPSRLGGLRSLRLKESDRLAALETELVRFGAVVTTGPDWIAIKPGKPRPTTFNTHNDHRIAMSLGLLGLLHDGIEIIDAHVVEKTWPEYWNWIASVGCLVTTESDN